MCDPLYKRCPVEIKIENAEQIVSVAKSLESLVDVGAVVSYAVDTTVLTRPPSTDNPICTSAIVCPRTNMIMTFYSIDDSYVAAISVKRDDDYASFRTGKFETIDDLNVWISSMVLKSHVKLSTNNSALN